MFKVFTRYGIAQRKRPPFGDVLSSMYEIVRYEGGVRIGSGYTERGGKSVHTRILNECRDAHRGHWGQGSTILREESSIADGHRITTLFYEDRTTRQLMFYTVVLTKE